jgi:hypothetical protein
MCAIARDRVWTETDDAQPFVRVASDPNAMINGRWEDLPTSGRIATSGLRSQRKDHFRPSPILTFHTTIRRAESLALRILIEPIVLVRNPRPE